MPPIERREVQAHGFSWEKELLMNVYGATEEELRKLKYTSKFDLPSSMNRLDPLANLSIKTTCSPHTICMADCLRLFDTVSEPEPLHLVIIHYQQDDTRKMKRIQNIIEIDLTSSRELLFGCLTRSQIEALDTLIKRVPSNRKPTVDEYNTMYSFRDELQPNSGHIHLDIKCNSTQSRLQCSLTQFQQFIEKTPSRIIAQSETNEFRGGRIQAELLSARRSFTKKMTQTP